MQYTTESLAGRGSNTAQLIHFIIKMYDIINKKLLSTLKIYLFLFNRFKTQIIILLAAHTLLAQVLMLDKL